MPCSDPRDSSCFRESDPDPHLREENIRLSSRCAMLTDLLCKVGRARYRQHDIPPEVLDYWREHCALDSSRGEPW